MNAIVLAAAFVPRGILLPAIHLPRRRHGRRLRAETRSIHPHGDL